MARSKFLQGTLQRLPDIDRYCRETGNEWFGVSHVVSIVSDGTLRHMHREGYLMERRFRARFNRQIRIEYRLTPQAMEEIQRQK